MPGQPAYLPQLRVDHAGRALRRRLGLVGVPGPHRLALDVEAVDGLDEVALKRAAPELAVGEDLEAELALLLEHAQDLAVLDRAQRLGVGPARARVQQCGRTKKTSDMVGPIRSTHADECGPAPFGPC